MSIRTLVVIDLQNDYFAHGKFPLWQAEAVLDANLAAIAQARRLGIAIVLVRHQGGDNAPFFTADSDGAALHPRLRAAAPDAPVVTKQSADAFLNTDLEEILSRLGTQEMLITGMMTQNCVTHTALSKAAEKYDVTVLGDCCTTVTEMIHLIALRALADRVPVRNHQDALPPSA